MVVTPLEGLEVDVLMLTQDGLYLDWGAVNGTPLYADALRWVAHTLHNELLEALHDACAA